MKSRFFAMKIRHMLCCAAVCWVLDSSAQDIDTVPSLPAGSSPVDAMTLATNTAEEIKADKLMHSHKILFAGSEDTPKASSDSIMYLVSSFYADQYRHFQDPLAPYFLLMSKDAKLAMGIGGVVRMRGWFDWNGSVPTNGFVPYMIPVPKDPEQRRGIGATPDGCSIFMRIIGRNATLGDIVGYIQGNFQADGHTFKLKKAYAQFKGFTVGYASTTFEDGDAAAPTIDGAGQNGISSVTRMLVRWDHTFKDKWGFAASVELPSSQTDTDGELTKTLKDWFPDFAAFLQYNLPHSGHLRLSGLLRVLPYRDLVAAKNRNKLGWGVQLSGVLYPTTRLALYLEANTGRGYESCTADLSCGNFDLVAEQDTPGRLYAPLAMGLSVGAKFNFLPNLYSCVALGEAHYFPKYTVKGDGYKYGLYGALNLFYEPTPRFQVGVEYLLGSRHNFNGEHASANRIDALFQFSF